MNRSFAIGIITSLLAVAAVVLVQRKDAAATAAKEPAFKASARVRSPAPRPSAINGFSGDLPAFTPPADRRTNILGLLAAGQDLRAQTAISEWFSVDPAAAGEWLEAQPSLLKFQAAISQISKNMAEAGYPLEALEWAQLLESGPERDQVIFQIYATGRRYHRLSDAQIQAAPFPPERIEALLSGAADD